MAMFQEGRGLAVEAEPLGLLTEGAAGIAIIVLSVIALAGTASGVLALVGVNAPYLVPSALIVFGGALLLSGALGMRPKGAQVMTPAGPTQATTYQGSAATGGMEIL